MVSHGLISALLFLLVGVVYHTTGTRDLQVLRGLLNPERGLPFVGSLMILGVMGQCPEFPVWWALSLNFLVFRGSFPDFPGADAAVYGGVGADGGVLPAAGEQGVFLDGLRSRLQPPLPKLDVYIPPVTWRDRLPALALASMIVAFGLQPNWMARWSEHTTLALHEPYQAYVQAKLEQNYPGPDRLGAEAIAEYLLP